jgi:hypothetical protein
LPHFKKGERAARSRLRRCGIPTVVNFATTLMLDIQAVRSDQSWSHSQKKSNVDRLKVPNVRSSAVELLSPITKFAEDHSFWQYDAGSAALHRSVRKAA